MYDRRDFLKTTGAVLGTGLVSGAASAQYDSFENYRLVGEAPVPGINEVVAQGDWAYATSQGSITTININDPTFPFVAGRAEGEDATDTPDVDVAGDVAALAHNDGAPGISLFDVSDPANPTFESFYEDNSTVHNCYLSQEPDTGRVYAYICISDTFPKARMVIVDVTDPANPETLEGTDPTYTQGSEVPPAEHGTGGAWMLNDAQPEMAEGSNSPIHDIYVETTDAGNGLAYGCFWDSGVVVVDVTDKRNPVAVGHFGGTPDATGDIVDYVTGEKTNAHYTQPTPDLGYTFVGAETFPGPSAPPGGDESSRPATTAASGCSTPARSSRWRRAAAPSTPRRTPMPSRTARGPSTPSSTAGWTPTRTPTRTAATAASPRTWSRTCRRRRASTTPRSRRTTSTSATRCWSRRSTGAASAPTT